MVRSEMPSNPAPGGASLAAGLAAVAAGVASALWLPSGAPVLAGAAVVASLTAAACAPWAGYVLARGEQHGDRPVRAGGAAVFPAIVVGWVLVPEARRMAVALLAAMALVWIAGIVHDRRGLPDAFLLMVEFVATTVLVGASIFVAVWPTTVAGMFGNLVLTYVWVHLIRRGMQGAGALVGGPALPAAVVAAGMAALFWARGLAPGGALALVIAAVGFGAAVPSVAVAGGALRVGEAGAAPLWFSLAALGMVGTLVDPTRVVVFGLGVVAAGAFVTEGVYQVVAGHASRPRRAPVPSLTARLAASVGVRGASGVILVACGALATTAAVLGAQAGARLVALTPPIAAALAALALVAASGKRAPT